MNVDKEKLMAMLSGAKKVMNKVESGNYSKGNIPESSLQSENVEYLKELPQGVNPQSNPTRQMRTDYPNLNTSKLPENIKRAMIENPIPKIEMGSGGGPTFSIDDVRELANEKYSNQMSQQRYAPQQQQYAPQQVNEMHITNSKGQMLITMTEAELDKKIQDALMSFMTTTFTKSLTENTIKQTITTLIREGKLRVKPKTTK